MLKSVLRRGLTLLGLAALAGSSTASAKTHQARPALWEVSDADTKIYLFGTIHLLPSDYQWRSPVLNKALASSQSLVVETIVDEKNPRPFLDAMARLGFSPGQPPIAARVPAAKLPLLDAAIRKSGQPRQAFDAMETWAAAFTLLGVQFQELGVSGDAGVETVLKREFAASSRPIAQLENISEQLSIFDGLPEKDQRAFLEGVIEDPKEMRKQFGGMLASWVRGDVDGIARTFNQDLSSSPAMMEALISRRNSNWAKWLENRMKSPGTITVAVGAGHLAGKDSVITMLERDGFKVRRVQ